MEFILVHFVQKFFLENHNSVCMVFVNLTSNMLNQQQGAGDFDRLIR